MPNRSSEHHLWDSRGCVGQSRAPNSHMWIASCEGSTGLHASMNQQGTHARARNPISLSLPDLLLTLLSPNSSCNRAQHAENRGGAGSALLTPPAPNGSSLRLPGQPIAERRARRRSFHLRRLHQTMSGSPPRSYLTREVVTCNLRSYM